MKILEIESLCKQYPSFFLDHVSFCMDEGAIMGLIGRNGAGKSTTLKSMLRLVHPDSGTVRICGLDMAGQERQIKARLGFVSGSAAYYPRKRVQELCSVTRRFYPGWDEQRCRALMERFRLDGQKRVCELSEGMKVKLQLMLAMSHGAQLLILDEPTSGLDPVSRDELLQLFRTLVSRDGVSILFSTHITSDLDACADAVTYLQSGHVFASLPKKELTGRYRMLRGSEKELGPELRAALIGLRVQGGEFEGLLAAEKLSFCGALQPQAADLEQIMVHLEREALQ